MEADETTGSENYEAPALVVLGPAEDLTLKDGSGADATSAFHMSI